MPRNVRNFWLEANIDGRDTTLEGGPISKDGGFRLTIYQRHNGDVVKALDITGQVSHDGELQLWVGNEKAKVTRR